MPAIQTIKFRRGTATQWSSANPVLSAGEMGVETDTRKFKFGNGSTQWNSIPYASAGGSTGGGFFVSEAAPVGANIGDIWYCSDDTGALAGKSFIRYDGYWVEINPGNIGPAGDAGATGAAGDTGVVIQNDAPTNTNILWLDADDPANQTTLPLGGTAGQVLTKINGTDYATQWSTLSTAYVDDVATLQIIGAY
jgi:hypothetical protein